MKRIALLISLAALLFVPRSLPARRTLIGECEPHREGGCRTCTDCSKCHYCHDHLGECSVCEGKPKR